MLLTAQRVTGAGLLCLAIANELWACSGQDPEGAPQQVHPDSFYWGMKTSGPSEAVAGFSFYTRIFSLFDEGIPLDMQMGMGGTW
eukprot:SAG31_NODE_19635_length_596_cov_0.726358_1_plen_84_part_10